MDGTGASGRADARRKKREGAPDENSAAISIDPFGYWPAWSSSIAGLGGSIEPEHLTYVFHTPYVEIEPGPVSVELKFDSLEAVTGSLMVRVYRFVQDGENRVYEQVVTTASLPTLAASRKVLRLAFIAEIGSTYAVAGSVLGECEANAAGLTLKIRREQDDGIDASERRSWFGRKTARIAKHFALAEVAQLASPVSQTASASQLAEPLFQKWIQLLSGSPVTEVWEVAYIVEALTVYGRLQPYARGIGLSGGPDLVGHFVSKARCNFIAAPLRNGETVVEAFNRLSPIEEEGPTIDFLWCRSDTMTGWTSAVATEVIHATLEGLRPGGLGIYMLPFAPGGAELLDETTRNALNRVALGLVAEGHFVAQLAFSKREDVDPALVGSPLAFGIIVRRKTDTPASHPRHGSI